jgi:hypothetical protein
MKRDDQEASDPATDAVGIVVQSGTHGEHPPRTIAFMWGREVCPAPSLPFGRWKTGVLSAA